MNARVPFCSALVVGTFAIATFAAADDPAPGATPAPSTSTSASASAPPATSASAAPATPPALAAGLGPAPMLRYANTWDVNLDFGGGDAFGDTKKGTYLMRGRVGALFIRNDSFYQIGALVEHTAHAKTAFGLQAEYLHLEMGAWIQVGGFLDLKARPGGMVAVGLSLFGFEVQMRQLEGIDDPSLALIGKIRIPIGIIAYALGARR